MPLTSAINALEIVGISVVEGCCSVWCTRLRGRAKSLEFCQIQSTVVSSGWRRASLSLSSFFGHFQRIFVHCFLRRHGFLLSSLSFELSGRAGANYIGDRERCSRPTIEKKSPSSSSPRIVRDVATSLSCLSSPSLSLHLSFLLAFHTP